MNRHLINYFYFIYALQASNLTVKLQSAHKTGSKEMGTVRGTAVLKQELRECQPSTLSSSLPLCRSPQEELLERLRARRLCPDEFACQSPSIFVQPDARR